VILTIMEVMFEKELNYNLVARIDTKVLSQNFTWHATSWKIDFSVP
jgi:hypothetical protein